MNSLGLVLGWAIRVLAGFVLVTAIAVAVSMTMSAVATDPELAYIFVLPTIVTVTPLTLLVVFGLRIGNALARLIQFFVGVAKSKDLGRVIGWSIFVVSAIAIISVLLEASEILFHFGPAGYWSVALDLLARDQFLKLALLSPLLAFAFRIGKALAKVASPAIGAGRDALPKAIESASVVSSQVTKLSIEVTKAGSKTLESDSGLKKIGLVLMAVGILWGIFALAMDTTVSSGDYPTRVHNIGLLDAKRTQLIISCLFVLVGSVFLVAGSKKVQTKSDHGSIAASSAPMAAPSTGGTSPPERSLESDAYQLYLVRKYSIEKNATLEKYVVRDRLFGTLVDALQYAHDMDVGASGG